MTLLRVLLIQHTDHHTLSVTLFNQQKKRLCQVLKQVTNLKPYSRLQTVLKRLLKIYHLPLQYAMYNYHKQRKFTNSYQLTTAQLKSSHNIMNG